MSPEEYVAGLRLFEACEGWDTLEGLVMVKGPISVGIREDPPHEPERAEQMRAGVQGAMAKWPVVDLAEPVPHPSPWPWALFNWPKLFVMDDKLGVAPELVAVVDDEYPEGEWRWGRYPHMTIGGGRTQGMRVLAKAVSGEVVGIVAPCLLKP